MQRYTTNNSADLSRDSNEQPIHISPYFLTSPDNSDHQQLSIPRTKLNLGKRAFSVAAPIIWIELPTTLKSCKSLASFRKTSQNLSLQNCFSTLVGGPLKLMMTPVISPRLLNMITDFVFFVSLLSSGPRGFKPHRSEVILYYYYVPLSPSVIANYALRRVINITAPGNRNNVVQ